MENFESLKVYRHLVKELAAQCNDMDLLDLVYKLLAADIKGVSM